MSALRGKIILILGGARSGKSTLAQSMAAQMGSKVLFCATAEPLDEEMRARIEEHKLSRPKQWDTLETTSKIGHKLTNLEKIYDVIIVDCITILVANIIGKQTTNKDIDTDVTAEIDELLKFIDTRKSFCILVSNEVGMGLVPDNQLGRIYRDILGKVNQRIAKYADEVYFMAAGIPLRVK